MVYDTPPCDSALVDGGLILSIGPNVDSGVGFKSQSFQQAYYNSGILYSSCGKTIFSRKKGCRTGQMAEIPRLRITEQLPTSTKVPRLKAKIEEVRESFVLKRRSVPLPLWLLGNVTRGKHFGYLIARVSTKKSIPTKSRV